VPSYLDASMETFAKNQEQMRKAFNANQPMTNFESMARGNVEWFEQAMRMFSPFGAAAGGDGKPLEGSAGQKTERSPEPEASVQKKSAPDMSKDFDKLQRQLGEMQAQLERLTRGKG
jgi:polyhydroxyalkanoate synthesis regulator protein